MLKELIILCTLNEYTSSSNFESIDNEDDKLNLSENILTCFISSFYIEIIIFSSLTYFLIKLFFFRKNKYIHYAKTWFKLHKDFFESQYDIPGYGNKPNQEFEMVEKNNRTYKYTASGRINVKWVICLLSFGKKNYFSLSNKDRDKIIYRISLDLKNHLPTVFCLCNRKDINIITNNYYDIKTFTKIYSPQYIPERSIVLAENCDVFNEIVLRVIDLYKSIENHIEMIYYSDQETSDQFTLYFSFQLNFKEILQINKELLLEFNSFVHTFIDNIKVYNMPANYKKEAFSRRVFVIKKSDTIETKIVNRVKKNRKK